MKQLFNEIKKVIEECSNGEMYEGGYCKEDNVADLHYRFSIQTEGQFMEQMLLHKYKDNKCVTIAGRAWKDEYIISIELGF
jgi:hypothetical protein